MSRERQSDKESPGVTEARRALTLRKGPPVEVDRPRPTPFEGPRPRPLPGQLRFGDDRYHLREEAR
jgi:hypothetical protein